MASFGFKLKSLVTTLLVALLTSPLGAQADQCDHLAKIVNESRPRSVDELLERAIQVPELKDHFKSYVLMYKSKSIQTVPYPSVPRAILFGRNSELVFSFLGRLQKSGKDAVEVMCWRAKEQQFEFYELDYSKNQIPVMTAKSANPAKCLACHGSDPRPIWESYNMWPGSFGSVSRAKCDTMRRDKPEFAYFEQFMKQNRNGARYKFLAPELPEPKIIHSPLGGIECPSDANPLSRNFRNASSHDPNSEILSQLTKLNKLRVARIIKSSPQFSKFKWAMAGITKSCKNISEFFPSDIHASGPSLEKTKADVVTTIKREHAERMGEFLENNDADPTFEGRRPVTTVLGFEMSRDLTDEVTLLKYLFDRMQIDVDYPRLSMGFTNGTFDFSTGTSGTTSFFHDIFKEMTSDDSSGAGRLGCVELQAKSQAELSGYRVREKPRINFPWLSGFERLEETDRRKTFNLLNRTCTNCHGVDQPALPLGDEQEFTNSLRTQLGFREKMVNRILGLHLKGRPQMPLGAPFDPETQIQVIKYINMLAEPASHEPQ